MSYSHFERAWRKTSSNLKLRHEILLSIDEEVIFRDNCEPLDQIITVLNQLEPDDIQKYESKIISILSAIVSGKRFGVSFAFMDDSSRKAAKSLLSKLDPLKVGSIKSSFQ